MFFLHSVFTIVNGDNIYCIQETEGSLRIMREKSLKALNGGVIFLKHVVLVKSLYKRPLKSYLCSECNGIRSCPSLISYNMSHRTSEELGFAGRHTCTDIMVKF